MLYNEVNGEIILRKILSYLRRAVDDYNMINDGDKIAVGVSGGKDSMILLNAMWELKRFYPKKFDLIGITIDMGFNDFDSSDVIKFCKEKGIPYKVVKTSIKEIIFDIRKESNPCSLCSKMRKGALNEAAKEMGFNKVALGHHFDDVIETFFLCLLYEGRIGCFSPVTYLDRTDIYQIRPLIYAHEYEIKSSAIKNNLPIIKNPCPVDGKTKRQDIKDFIKNTLKDYPDLKERVFGSLVRSDIDGWGIKRM